MLKKTEDERNFFIQTSREGEDAIGDDARDDLETSNFASTIGIGNGFITSYSTEASVGGFPTCSVSVEAMNMNFSTGTQSIPNPAINRTNGDAASTSVSLPTVSGAATFDTANNDETVEAALNISTLRPGDIKIMIAENQTN